MKTVSYSRHLPLRSLMTMVNLNGAAPIRWRVLKRGVESIFFGDFNERVSMHERGRE